MPVDSFMDFQLQNILQVGRRTTSRYATTSSPGGDIWLKMARNASGKFTGAHRSSFILPAIYNILLSVRSELEEYYIDKKTKFIYLAAASV